MVRVPAGLGRVDWGKEGVGPSEVIGEDKAESLEDEAALIGVIDGAGCGAFGETPEDGEVEGAWDGGGVVGLGWLVGWLVGRVKNERRRSKTIHQQT